MAGPIYDADRFFVGQLAASTPKHLIGEGEVIRLINARFDDGAITNAIAFDELDITFRHDKKIFASNTSFNELLRLGDVQLVAEYENLHGRFLVLVVSGLLIQVNLEDLTARDISFPGMVLPENSHIHPLSYITNNGGPYGVGDYLVIHNGFNRPIFIFPDAGPRHSIASLFEMPPSIAGATAGDRAAVVAYPNILYLSDPFGGGSPNAPLTFKETLDVTANYFAQTFLVGSVLSSAPVTAVCRLPSYMAPSEEFLARDIVISTATQKFIVALGGDRATWDASTFIRSSGINEGITGPLAWTNIGDILFYVSTSGRYKTLGQDDQRERGLSETFMDEALGQYMCREERSFTYKEWYSTLDHSRSIAKFHKNRLYVTAYPASYPAISRYGERYYSPSFRALAVGSVDPKTRLGPTASMAWEGFYDWLQPIGLAVVGQHFYVVSKDHLGIIRFYKENRCRLDTHLTTIYTRGYFAGNPNRARSGAVVELYFRELNGPIKVRIWALIDNNWCALSECEVEERIFRQSLPKRASGSWSMPLIIEIDHNGCLFELESIRIDGEAHRDKK